MSRLRRAFAGMLKPIQMVTHGVVAQQWAGQVELCIAVIADLHAAEPMMGKEQFAEIQVMVERASPDLILLAGDYVSNRSLGMRPVPIKAVAEFLGSFRAPLGVYAVLGNHDWFDDPEAQRDRSRRTIVWDALSQAGVDVLENESRHIVGLGRSGAHDFHLAGLGSQLAYIEGGTKRSGRDDMDATMKDIPTKAAAILLAHEPNCFPAIPERFALMVSGHTHGGQVRINNRSLTGSKVFGSGFDYGHFEREGRHLLVSGGLGYSVAPVRINNPPEITMIHLTAPA